MEKYRKKADKAQRFLCANENWPVDYPAEIARPVSATNSIGTRRQSVRYRHQGFDASAIRYLLDHPPRFPTISNARSLVQWVAACASGLRVPSRLARSVSAQSPAALPVYSSALPKSAVST